MLSMVTLTFSAWWIPGIISAVILCLMFRPVHGSDFYGMDSALRILWLLPLLLVWAVFFGIMYFIK